MKPDQDQDQVQDLDQNQDQDQDLLSEFRAKVGIKFILNLTNRKNFGKLNLFQAATDPSAINSVWPSRILKNRPRSLPTLC